MPVLNETPVPARDVVDDARPIKPAVQPFFWPSPPGAHYPAATALEAHEPCVIVGLNGRQTRARLRTFSLAERRVLIQLPSARSPMPLAFSQFQSLLLETPLCASDGGGSGSERPERPYSVHLVSGQTLHGDTIGQLSNELGLFLFPPLDELGTVQRLFIPKEAMLSSDLAPAHRATAQAEPPRREPLAAEPSNGLYLLPLDDDDGSAPASRGPAPSKSDSVDAPDNADELQVAKVDTPHALMTAIARQRNMPLVRIGETLVSMGLITPGQLQEVLARQQADPTVPLGELLVAMELVTRKDLTQALARKMGYPLVDLASFPIDPNALVKVPFHVAMRLKLIPLMLRDAALIVAMADPSKRDALSELEFITQSKVLPVLAEFNQLERAIRDAYAKLGADVQQDLSAGYPEADMDLDALNSGKLVEDLERAGMDADDDEMPLEQSDNSLVRLVNTMVMEAHSQGVSTSSATRVARRSRSASARMAR
jgi:Type II secretion system (T2SS), protein E, N-terminal domain